MALDVTPIKSSQVLLHVLVLVATATSELKFIAQPTPRTVLQGADVTFYCIVNDGLQASHDMVWYRGNIEISRNGQLTVQNERLQIESDEDHGSHLNNLIINDVSLTDDTLYYCQVEDPSTTPVQHLLTSNQVRLEVHHVPEHKYPSCFPLTQDHFLEGEEITITCQSTRGNPPVTLMWTRDGENLASLPYDTEGVYRNIDYTFTTSRRNHGDIFQCKLTTIAAAEVHRSCSLGPLDVRYPPAEVSVRGAASAEPGQEIALSCGADANPRPEYSWTFSESLDPGRLSYSEENRKITFLSQLSDHGLIVTCNATNELGTEGGSVTLAVSSPVATKPAAGTTPSEVPTPKLDSSHNSNGPQTDNEIILKPEVLAIIASTLTLILLVLIVLVVITCRCRPQSPKAVSQMPQMIYGQYGPSSIQGWEQGSIYFEPRDRISVRDMPAWQRPAPWHRSVAVQVPWIEEPPYEEIGQNWDEGMTLEI